MEIDINKDATVEFISNGQASGATAARLLANGMNINAARPWIGSDGRSYVTVNVGGKPKAVPLQVNAATLRKDEWKEYDTAVLEAAKLRLGGIADLQSRGLVYNVPNGLGTTVLEYETESDLTDAELSMDGVTRTKKDRPVYGMGYLPLPVISKDFSINARVLAASRTTGRPLDTTTAALAARKVAEKLETILFQGASSYAYGSGTIYGYQDFTYRSSVTLTENWDASSCTGADVLDDVVAMKQASINDRHYGPWILYIPTAWETSLDTDYDATTPGTTIRERILKVSGIEAVKVSDFLTANNAVLVEMSKNTVRLVNGLNITTVEWAAEGNMVFHYKVMCIMVPQMFSDYNNRSGIVHLAA